VKAAAVSAVTGLVAGLGFAGAFVKDANSRRPRRIIRDGERVTYDSHQTVCEISGWKWDREQFCSHWLITADTDVGKTSSKCST
jgi:hypothetical protein